MTKEEPVVMFEPTSIQALVHSIDGGDIGNNRIDRLIEISVHNEDSVFLRFFNDDNLVRGVEPRPLEFILDLTGNMFKEHEEIDEQGFLMFVRYRYVRQTSQVVFEVIPLTDQAGKDLQALDFLFSQYTMKENMEEGGFIGNFSSNEQHANALAKGLESGGTAVRTLLRTSGQYTGHAIRYLGSTYTSIRTAILPPAYSPGDAPAPSSRSVHRAHTSVQWARGVHAGTRTITSTLLFPVRMLGSAATAMSPAQGSAAESDAAASSSSSGWGKGVMETAAGLGNGLAHVCKGFTEALSEVGEAIGDSALEHNRRVRGERYAEE
eukprot:gene44424-54327_t